MPTKTPGGSRGGRAAAFFVAVAVAYPALCALVHPAQFDRWFAPVVGLSMYMVTVLLIPSAIAAKWTSKPKFRLLASTATPAFVAFAMVTPYIYALAMGSLRLPRHAGNPIDIIERTDNVSSMGSSGAEILMTLSIALAVALAINTPRMVRGIIEVREQGRAGHLLAPGTASSRRSRDAANIAGRRRRSACQQRAGSARDCPSAGHARQVCAGWCGR